MFGLCTEIPLNRTGINLHGFHYLSAQMGAFYPEAADRLGGIHPIREYSPAAALQHDPCVRFLQGALLLIANVAFLTVPNFDPGDHVRNPAQLASHLSTITSIGSTVTGLLLLRQHRTKPHDTAGEVVRDISNLSPLTPTHCDRGRIIISEAVITVALGLKPSQSSTACHIRCCSGRKWAIVA